MDNMYTDVHCGSLWTASFYCQLCYKQYNIISTWTKCCRALDKAWYSMFNASMYKLCVQRTLHTCGFWIRRIAHIPQLGDYLMGSTQMPPIHKQRVTAGQRSCHSLHMMVGTKAPRRARVMDVRTEHYILTMMVVAMAHKGCVLGSEGTTYQW